MILNKEYILDFLRKNREYLKQNFEVTSISLFGSFARGAELHNLVGVINFLEKSFDRKVDIIRSRPNMHPRFTKHLMREKINA